MKVDCGRNKLGAKSWSYEFSKLPCIRLFCAGLLLLLSSLAQAQMEGALPTDVPTAHLKPFLEQNCISCHGPDKQKGQLRLDQMDWTITNNDQAQYWQDILDVLNADEMPPEEEPRPDKDQLLNVLNTLTKTMRTSKKRLTDTGGTITMRHLNRREYVNSIYDLFGFYISEHALPEDMDSDNFDTVGVDQFFSSIHFKRYLELGTQVANLGFQWSGRPLEKTNSRRHEPEKRANDRMKSSLKKASEQMKMVEAGKTWKETGFNDEVEMKLFKNRYDGRYGVIERYLELPQAETGLYLYTQQRGIENFTVHNDRVDPRGVYRVKIRAGTVDGTHPDRHFLYINGVDPLGVLKVTGTEFRPEVVEIPMTPKLLAENRRNALTFYECSPYLGASSRFKSYLKKIGDQSESAALWVDWVEVEGPFYPEEENFFGSLIGKSGLNLTRPEQARVLLEKFAYEAFRRKQPEPEYVDKLLMYFQQSMEHGESYQEAMSKTLAVILTSPSFLYIEEAPNRERITPQEFAIRLSYFLWSGPPDEELYRLAESGELYDDSELKRQVTRMLNAPKAQAFYEGFMGQWAELDRFFAISVDKENFYRYNQGVQTSAAQEVVEFFKVLVKENLPVDNLIDSNFVVINAHLGAYYGINRANSNHFQKVGISSNSPRGGFITQAAFLTMGSNGERSSPVIRGTMVLDKILNDPPPPPPPNVPELGAQIDEPLSNRKMVELHQTETTCASCHRNIDPIGFGMENYDTIGMFRTHEAVGKSQEPIERGGQLGSGLNYRDIDELKTLLKTQRHLLAEGFIESLVSYGIGRTIEFSDADAIVELTQESGRDQYRIQTMIYNIVSSEMFSAK